MGPPSLRLAAMGRLPSLRLLLVLGLACGRVAGLGAAVAGQARAYGCTRRVPLRMHFVRPCGYTRGADDGSVVDEALVERMLSERSLLRHEKRFYEADALRDRLNEMGVWIYDRERRWVCANNFPRVRGYGPKKGGTSPTTGFDRGDPRVLGYGPEQGAAGLTKSSERTDEFRRILERSEPNELGHEYIRAVGDQTPMDGATLLGVNELLKQRLEAKRAHEFSKADALLARLSEEHGVTVHDGKKLWRADGASFDRQYERHGNLDAEVDAALVERLVRERTVARRRREYERADEILQELLEKHGVVLFDAHFSWRVVGEGFDGAYGEGVGWSERAKRAYARVGHNYLPADGVELQSIPDDQMAHIHKLLSSRQEAKKARDYIQSDALLSVLVEKFGVIVDDRRRAWTFSAKSRARAEARANGAA